MHQKQAMYFVVVGRARGALGGGLSQTDGAQEAQQRRLLTVEL